jgi:hypothetical protein
MRLDVCKCSIVRVLQYLAIGLALVSGGLSLRAQDLQITEVAVTPEGYLTIAHDSSVDPYHVPQWGAEMSEITNAVAMNLGSSGSGRFEELEVLSATAFFCQPPWSDRK